MWIVRQLSLVAISLGDNVTPERLEVYAEDLADISREALAAAFIRVRREYEYPKLPPVSYIRRMAGAGPHADGRPGPEEAWARMPKGDRREDDTIVWTDEERIAYGACRSLLIDGDQIGARMAFKERYEREIAAARSEGRRVEWKVSAGFDVGHRLMTLALAVQEKRLTVAAAAEFIPGDQRNDFARMLPAGEAKGLLAGEVDPLANLPGLAGVISRMHMEGKIPEELKPVPSQLKPRRLSEEELAERKKQNEQAIRALMEREAGHTLTDEEIRQRELEAVQRVQHREPPAASARPSSVSAISPKTWARSQTHKRSTKP